MSKTNFRFATRFLRQSPKLLLGFSFLLINLTLAACGDTATSAATNTVAATATSQPTTTVASTTTVVNTTTIAATTAPATTVIAATTTQASTTQATTTAPATTATTNATTTAITTSAAATTTQAGATTTEPTPPNLPGDATQGKIVFTTNCSGCHPNGGTEAGYGPNLSTSQHAIDPTYVTHNVRLGRGFMPPFTKDQVSDQDLANIIAYLKSIHKS